MKLKFHLIILLQIAVCAILLSGCLRPNVAHLSENMDDTPGGECTKIAGVALEDGDITLDIDLQGKSPYMTQDAMITNTKKIVVSITNITNNAELNIYLYSSDNAETPIGYATLSADQKKATFSNLTSAVAYKIGADFSNAETPISITITD